MSILIKQAELNGKICDLLIKEDKIIKIADSIAEPANTVINAKDKAIIPGFYNLHTHSGMSILRGYSDDKELFSWLSEDIWPLEDKFDRNVIFTATRLALLEMIKTGTLGFCDMYFDDMQDIIMDAVNEMGSRALVSMVTMDLFNEDMKAKKIRDLDAFCRLSNPCPARIVKGISIHAVYTASLELMRYAADKAKEYDMPLHIHACETKKEVDDCMNKYGKTPVEVLNDAGLLTNKTILAHSVWLNDKDIDIINEKGCVLCANPVSNLKLCSGIFNYDRLRKKGCHIALGTDGCASNNNLSMIEEMKFLALLAKIQSGSPTVAPAEEVFEIATKAGAEALGFDAGEIKEGKLADLLLVDLNNPLLVPHYNLISNMVYAADSSVIDTVICGGKVVMLKGQVTNHDKIINSSKELAKRLSLLAANGKNG